MNRKKITFTHNEDPNNRKERTTWYFKSVEEFLTTMKARKKNLYPHLDIEIVSVEDIEVDPYKSAYEEDKSYNYNG